MLALWLVCVGLALLLIGCLLAFHRMRMERDEARAATLREAADRAEHGPHDGYDLGNVGEIGDWLRWLADEASHE